MRVVIKNCRNCGTAHDWEFERPFLKEARFIDRTYGMNATQFQDGLNEEGTHEALEATAALFDILHRREGIVIPQLEIDLDWEDLEVLPTEQEAEAAAKAEQEAAEVAAGKEPGEPTTPPS
ncbi:hypothetical protein [Actinacidiphila oryziradicis]|uniref:hypothetical protein n=1 Tax=Actinacidiphila oryziradicis TaxID=2571141 RepID=UPI0023F3ADAA|nr:hypothetical protein [Actinacidiphila oryziradicis]MCW2872560.1 hypothetical protein [Actinacidiphila oryziradicis]